MTLKFKRAIELLDELLMLKSNQDGIQRSSIGQIGDPTAYDEFAQDVQETALLIFAAQMSAPLMDRLSVCGWSFHEQGLIKADYGDSLAEKALDHLEATQEQVADLLGLINTVRKSTVDEVLSQIKKEMSSGENSDQWTITCDMAFHAIELKIKNHFGCSHI